MHEKIAKPRCTLSGTDGNVFALAALGIAFFALTIGQALWLATDHAPGIETATVENPEVLPWYWSSSDVGYGHTAFLCRIDINATFIPMGTMDTGRREVSPVMAYRPRHFLFWQCPQGTIVEMSEESLATARQALLAKETATHEARIRSQKAQELTQP